jgi:predicted NAD-dependent protein-ADP-ribosyltransferase YbiA (DUF1768 family)
MFGSLAVIEKVKKDNQETRFYRTSEAYRCFSTFSDHSIFLEDMYWKTAEHYFQAQQLEDYQHQFVSI